jgi:hypothetical protein
VLGDPTFASGKSEYAAGSTVTFKGSDWAGDSSAHVVLLDPTSADVEADAKVKIDADGNFTVDLNLPRRFIATLLARVTGNDTDRTRATKITESVLGEVTVATDQADYSPSSIVKVTGTGWQGDSAVRLQANDTKDQTWKLDVILATNSDGTISDSFPLPDYFVSDYDLTVTGINSARIARTTFTDASNATITVQAAGARTSVTAVSGLDGVIFDAYKVNDSSTLTIPSGSADATCTTATSGPTVGTCSMSVTFSKKDQDYLVVERSAPGTWRNLISFSPSDYRFNVSVSDNDVVSLPGGSRRWANAEPNPAWPGFCGMNVALLFDESTSISGTEWAQMKTAAKGFVDSLAGTPSNISIFSFATTAPANTTKGLTSVSSAADVTALKAYIDAMSQKKGGTNWDAGLEQIALSGQHLDAVLMLTDGDPTFYNGGGDGSSVELQNVEEAVHSANAVKLMSGSPRVLGIGIGISGNSYLNLSAISGPTANSDYYLTDFSGLEAQLKAIAAAQCGGKIIIQKQIGSAIPGAVTADTNGWAFASSALSSGSITPSSGVTAHVGNSDGVLELALKDGTWPKSVTIAETLNDPNKPGYSFVDVKCLKNGVAVGTPNVVNGSVAITGIAVNDTVGCTFLNSRNVASLTIHKVLNAPAAAPVPASYSVNYDCGVGYTGSRSVTTSLDATVTGIPTGNTCTVTEVAPSPISGYTWSTAGYTPVSQVMAAGGKTITVTNTLTADTGSLTITKTVSNLDDAVVQSTFPVSYVCDALAGTTTVAVGSPRVISGIPTGTSCTVTEGDLTAVNGFTWADPTVTPVSVVMASGGKTITVANSISRDRGSLTITKTVSNPDDAVVQSTFPVSYVCDALTGTTTVAVGSPRVISGIPTGTSCTVTEGELTAVNGFTWGPPVITGSPTAGVVKGQTVNVTVANSITRDRGVLTIAKTVANVDGASVPSSFSVGYDCGVGYTGSRSVTTSVDATVSGIPTGNSCTVTESVLAPIAGFTWADPIFTPVSVVMASGGKKITVANSITRDLGSLTITKSVSNPDGATVQASFPVSYVCDAMSGTTTVAVGTPRVISGIPTGTSCTVTEGELAAVNGFTWGAPVITGSPTAGVVKGQTVNVTVANSITRDRGSLTITKRLIDGGAVYSKAFDIDYVCALDGSSDLSGTVSVPAGTSKTVTDIPSGFVCEVSEALPSAVAGFTWVTPVVTGSPTAPIVKGREAGVEVVNQLNAIPAPTPITPTPVAVAVITPEGVTPPPVGVVTPDPVGVAVPTVNLPIGFIPTGVNAGDGSSRSGGGNNLWALFMLFIAATGYFVAKVLHLLPTLK